VVVLEVSWTLLYYRTMQTGHKDSVEVISIAVSMKFELRENKL